MAKQVNKFKKMEIISSNLYGQNDMKLEVNNRREKLEILPERFQNAKPTYKNQLHFSTLTMNYLKQKFRK